MRCPSRHSVPGVQTAVARPIPVVEKVATPTLPSLSAVQVTMAAYAVPSAILLIIKHVVIPLQDSKTIADR